MIRVQTKKVGGESGKYTRGFVEVDGVDISNHCTGFDISYSAMEVPQLRLDVTLGKTSDEVECEFTEDEVGIRARVIYKGVEMWAEVDTPEQVRALLKSLAA